MLLAVIREAECIGCVKCIDACPVDAIIGSAKHLHTVISDECIGCKLCVAPCPVDCIDLVSVPLPLEKDKNKIALSQKRYQSRKKRLSQNEKQTTILEKIIDPKTYVEAALLRAKMKNK